MTIFGTDFQANDFGTDMEEKLFRGRDLQTRALYIMRNLGKHVRVGICSCHVFARICHSSEMFGKSTVDVRSVIFSQRVLSDDSPAFSGFNDE